jgi:hypothetical protein
MDVRTKKMSPQLLRAALRAHIQEQYDPNRGLPPEHIVLSFLQADLDSKCEEEARRGTQAADR